MQNESHMLRLYEHEAVWSFSTEFLLASVEKYKFIEDFEVGSGRIGHHVPGSLICGGAS